jgi:hypothetical protein
MRKELSSVCDRIYLIGKQAQREISVGEDMGVKLHTLSILRGMWNNELDGINKTTRWGQRTCGRNLRLMY